MTDLYMPRLIHLLPKVAHNATDSLWLAVRELQTTYERIRNARMSDAEPQVPRAEPLDPIARIERTARLEAALLSMIGLFEELNAAKPALGQEGGTEQFRTTPGRPSFYWYVRVHRILLDEARAIREVHGL